MVAEVTAAIVRNALSPMVAQEMAQGTIPSLPLTTVQEVTLAAISLLYLPMTAWVVPEAAAAVVVVAAEAAAAAVDPLPMTWRTQVA